VKEKGDIAWCARARSRRRAVTLRSSTILSARLRPLSENQFERDYMAKMRFVFRHFPLASHANVTPLLNYAHL
jgi:hypothetical protein